MSKGKARKREVVELVSQDIQEIDITVEGITPLVMNCFPPEVQKKIENKAQGKAVKTKKIDSTTEEDYHRAFYTNPDCDDADRYWVPAVVFKAAINL